jgi:Protein of unknown function (DUF2721)
MLTPVADNPFAVLTLIAAPAVFTNASSVLALGTSNRLARAVDRTRQLAKELQHDPPDHDLPNEDTMKMWGRQIDRLQIRASLLVRALSFFYTAIGAFAGASLVSIIAASLAGSSYKLPFAAVAAVSVIAGTLGFIGLVMGCSLLVRETRLALISLSEEAKAAKTWVKQPG